MSQPPGSCARQKLIFCIMAWHSHSIMTLRQRSLLLLSQLQPSWKCVAAIGRRRCCSSGSDSDSSSSSSILMRVVGATSMHRRPFGPQWRRPWSPPVGSVSCLERAGASYYSNSARGFRTITTTTNATVNTENEPQPPPSNRQEFDVVIVGGGVVGATLADQLAWRCNNQLRIALVESSSGPTAGPAATAAATGGTKPSPPHPRSYALSPASMKLLQSSSSSAFKSASNHSQAAAAFPFDTTNMAVPLQGGYYQSMQIWEAGQPASLVLSTSDLLTSTNSSSSNSNKNDDDSPYLGCCIEDSVLQRYLWHDRLASNTSSNNVSLYASTRCTHLDWNAVQETGWVHGTLEQQTSTSTTIANESTTSIPFSTRLIVAADGSQSALRQAVGIEMMKLDYGQSALTFTVSLATPNSQQNSPRHSQRAYQRFLATGPLALLPTWSPHHAVVVWSTTPDEVKYWKEQAATQGGGGGGNNGSNVRALLVDHLNALLQAGPEPMAPLGGWPEREVFSSWPPSPISNLLYGVDKVLDAIQTGATLAAAAALTMDRNDGYGSNSNNGTGTSNTKATFQAPPLIQEIVSPYFTFPLQCQVPHPVQRNATQCCYTMGTHLAVIGDAAHTVHPLAGQGLNLGLQDVAALVDCVQRAVTAGMPIGSFLPDYEQSRRHQVGLTVAGIHAIQRMFAEQHVLGKHVKALGMNAIQLCTPVRQGLVQAACHGVVSG